MKTLEYRVRPVTRFIVTEYHEEDHGNGRASAGSRGIGEFDSVDQANEVAAMYGAANPESVVIEGRNPRDADRMFYAEYDYAGSHWGLDFYALDHADAVAKIGAIKASVRLSGEVGDTIVQTSERTGDKVLKPYSAE